MEFSTLKIGDLVANVKDDTARSGLTSLASRVTTLENNSSSTQTTSKITFDNNVISNSSSNYSYEYTTLKVTAGGARYLMLWGLTSAKGNQTITLPFAMYNANYAVVASDKRTSSNTTYSAVESVTTTSFKVVANNSNYVNFIVFGRIS